MIRTFSLSKAAASVCAVLLTAAAAFSVHAQLDESEPDVVVSAYSQSAIVAGGCFWCVESDFEKLAGVGDVVSGYTGGELIDPTYRNHEGHVEAVRIPFDPEIVSYRELMDYFFRHIDPLDDGGQFCDRGYAYTTAIFFEADGQKADAEAAKAAAESELGETVVTPIREATQFWLAEDYHQDYYTKNPLRYKFYRTSCGRDRRVKKLWGDKPGP